MYNTNPFHLTQNMNNEETALMTPPELAVYLGIGRNRAYNLLKDGVIKGFRIGSTWKVSKEAVDRYIREQSGM